MLLSLEGEEATGKTSLAYTAPTKVVGFAFDMGIERALFGSKHQEIFGQSKIRIVPYSEKPEPQWEDVDICVYELPQPIQLESIRLYGCIALWRYFVILAAEAMKDVAVRTLVVDTMTLARRIKADAYLEQLQLEAEEHNKTAAAKDRKPMRERLIQIEYGNPNDAIRDFYTMSQGVRKNLIAVHHLTDERKDTISPTGLVVQGVLTGKRILEGLSQTYRFVDVALRMEKVRAGNGPSIVATFIKNGYNLRDEGTSISDPTWDKIVSLIGMGLGGRIQFERRTPDGG